MISGGLAFNPHFAVLKGPNLSNEAYMDQPICAVYDKKTGLFDNIFVTRHIGEATREWDIIRKNPETKFGKNPEDFDLYQLGTYNYTTGALVELKPHTCIAPGV